MPVHVPFWELEDGLWEDRLHVGLRSHYIASRCAAPRMGARRKGLIVNTSSGGAVRYTFNVPFGVQKAGVDKMAKDMAHDLKPFNVAAVVIWPGFIKSEKLLAQPDRVPAPLAKRIMESGECSEFAGRAGIGLAADPAIMEKSGRLHLAVADPVLLPAESMDAAGRAMHAKRRLLGHLRLGDDAPGRRLPFRKRDGGRLAHEAAAAVAADEIRGAQRYPPEISMVTPASSCTKPARSRPL